MSQSLHSQIMNIPCDVSPGATETVRGVVHGHKQARQAAAELALKYDTFVEEMREAAKGKIGCAFIAAALKRLDGEQA